MAYHIEHIQETHYDAMLDIFNYYVRNSFAAYPESPLQPEMFAGLIASIKKHPAAVLVTDEGMLAGFAFLRPYHALEVFRQTAEITCFIAPEHTGKGAGALVLEYLEAEGYKSGIKNILAGISGFNEGSIKFHTRHGFVECGRFAAAGNKFGRDFDIVWMQKKLK